MNVRIPSLVTAAAAVGVGGFVHYRIWQREYRHAPVREMFVANWALSAVVVVALLALAASALAGRSPAQIMRATVLAGLLLSLGSLAAFALSRGPGLPTLHGNFKEHGLETTSSYFFHVGSAKTILVAEAIAAAACGALLVEQTVRPAPRPA